MKKSLAILLAIILLALGLGYFYKISMEDTVELEGSSERVEAIKKTLGYQDKEDPNSKKEEDKTDKEDDQEARENKDKDQDKEDQDKEDKTEEDKEKEDKDKEGKSKDDKDLSEKDKKAFDFYDMSLSLDELEDYGLPIVLSFGSEDCVYCKKMHPHLRDLNEEYQGQIIVKYVDIDENLDFAINYPIQATPATMVIEADGSAYTPESGSPLLPLTYSYKDRENDESISMIFGYLSPENLEALAGELDG